MWNAGSDLFQLRVQGPYALDCVQPDAAVIVVWALFLVASLIKQKHNLMALRNKNATLQQLRRSLYTDELTRLLVLDLVVATPLLIAAACLKLADRQTVVLGSDVAFTLLLTSGVLLTVVIWCAFQVMSFRVLVMAHLFAANKVHRILFKDKGLQATLALSYGLLTLVPTLCALGLNQSVGPIQSSEWIIIVIRNIGVMVWQLCGLAGSLLLLKEVRLLQASTIVGPDSSGAKSLQSTSAKRVIEYLAANAKSIFRSNCLVLIIYSIFSMPLAWPYQTFGLCISLITLVRGYSLGKIILASRSAATNGTLNGVTSTLASPNAKVGSNSGNTGEKYVSIWSPNDHMSSEVA